MRVERIPSREPCMSNDRDVSKGGGASSAVSKARCQQLGFMYDETGGSRWAQLHISMEVRFEQRGQDERAG